LSNQSGQQAKGKESARKISTSSQATTSCAYPTKELQVMHILQKRYCAMIMDTRTFDVYKGNNLLKETLKLGTL